MSIASTHRVRVVPLRSGPLALLAQPLIRGIGLPCSWLGGSIFTMASDDPENDLFVTGDLI